MFMLPDLPYAYNALEPYIDERTMHVHHDKHHAGYVKNLNAALSGQDKLFSCSIEDLLADLSQIPETVRTAVVNNGGGHANHSIFWSVMAPPTVGAAQGKLAQAIDSAFGSFEKFMETFTKAATGHFGSGWVWLVVSGGKLSVVSTANQDSPLSGGKTPLLCIDLWEHAYYLKYQNKRADYIAAWWHVVNWREVERRYALS